MWIVATLSVLLSSGTPTTPTTPVGDASAHLASIASDAEVGCFAPAAGRSAVPIRENFFTYSPVVGSIGRDQVFFGRRVGGENKVLVLTPHAAGAVGLARFTFTREVPKEQCRGARLYAPLYDELEAWTPPLPGQLEAPRSPGRHFSAFGCYSMDRTTRLGGTAPGAARLTLAQRQLFLAGQDDDDGRYGSRLVVVDGADGTELGTVSTARVTRVPLVECRGPVPFSVAR